MSDNKSPLIKSPLLLSYLSPLTGDAAKVQPLRKNSFYNSNSYEIIPFYKPVSLLISGESNLTASFTPDTEVLQK